MTSHGTLAWPARALGVPGHLVASAWGTDILVTPQRRCLRWVTSRVFAPAVTPPAIRRHGRAHAALGAREVMTFRSDWKAACGPCGQGAWLFFANRGARRHLRPHAGAGGVCQRGERGRTPGWSSPTAARCATARRVAAGPRWPCRIHRSARCPHAIPLLRPRSLVPERATSDSVSVSVLEAMAHGCIPCCPTSLRIGNWCETATTA